MIFIGLLFLSAFAVSACAAWFSVAGLISIFSSAPLATGLMEVVLNSLNWWLQAGFIAIGALLLGLLSIIFLLLLSFSVLSQVLAFSVTYPRLILTRQLSLDKAPDSLPSSTKR